MPEPVKVNDEVTYARSDMRHWVGTVVEIRDRNVVIVKWKLTPKLEEIKPELISSLVTVQGETTTHE